MGSEAETVEAELGPRPMGEVLGSLPLWFPLEITQKFGGTHQALGEYPPKIGGVPYRKLGETLRKWSTT